MFAVLHSDINSLMPGLLYLTGQPYCKKVQISKSQNWNYKLNSQELSKLIYIKELVGELDCCVQQKVQQLTGKKSFFANCQLMHFYDFFHLIATLVIAQSFNTGVMQCTENCSVTLNNIIQCNFNGIQCQVINTLLLLYQMTI